jgi:hypothetical protein
MSITREDLDVISELIAANTILHGVDRVITQEVLKERCRHYTEVAKRELQECGPSSDNDSSGFTPTATVFGANGLEAPNVRVGFEDGQKRRMMRALSETCKTMLAQAVILRIVATTANTLTLAKAMELNMPDPYDRQKMKYFEERMWKWIEKNYGRQRLSALPPEYRTDVIMVGGMGPKLRDTGTMTEYRWENDKLICGETLEDGEVRMEMIPRWWQ